MFFVTDGDDVASMQLAPRAEVFDAVDQDAARADGVFSGAARTDDGEGFEKLHEADVGSAFAIEGDFCISGGSAFDGGR